MDGAVTLEVKAGIAEIALRRPKKTERHHAGHDARDRPDLSGRAR